MSDLSGAVFGAQLIVALSSCFLVCFYVFQYYQGKGTFHSIFVQSITAIVYLLGSFGDTGFLQSEVIALGGTREMVQIGRYLFWVTTCPVIIANFYNILYLPGEEPLKTEDVVFTMSKDIVLISFGVMAVFQKNQGMKITFICLSLAIALWLIVSLILTIRRKKADFGGETWSGLRLLGLLFLSTWLIFPLLYFLGPITHTISAEADQIGHAVGDLLAKNLLGFSFWYYRYQILEPYIEDVEEENGKSSIQPISSYSSLTKIDPAVGGGVKKTPSHHGKPKKVQKTLRVLIIEPDAAFQRLFQFMFQFTPVECELAFDFDQAQQIIRRSRLNDICCVLCDLTEHFHATSKIEAFRRSFGRKPYHLPMVGYTFDLDSEPLLEQEEAGGHLVDGIIRHILDEVYLVETLTHWQKIKKEWKEQEEKRELEMEHFKSHMSPHHRLGSVYGHGSVYGGDDDAHTLIGESHPVELHLPHERIERRDSFYQNNNMHVDTTRHPPLQREASLRAIHEQNSPYQNNHHEFSQSPMTSSPRSPGRPGSPRTLEQHGRSMSIVSPPTSPNFPNDLPVEECSAESCTNNAEMMCGGCSSVAYCTKACQLKHWPSHKQECSKLAVSQVSI